MNLLGRGQLCSLSVFSFCHLLSRFPSTVFHNSNSPFLCSFSVGEHIHCYGECNSRGWLCRPSALIKSPVSATEYPLWFFRPPRNWEEALQLLLSWCEGSQVKTGKIGNTSGYAWSTGCGHGFKNGTRKRCVRRRGSRPACGSLDNTVNFSVGRGWWNDLCAAVKIQIRKAPYGCHNYTCHIQNQK